MSSDRSDRREPTEAGQTSTGSRVDAGSGPLPRFGLRSLFLAILVAAVVVGLATGFASWVRQARRDAFSMVSQGSLNQLALALHNYHDVYGEFPPAYVADANGNRMHSWRALILPFIAPELHAAYNFQEPWNGPNNSKLASQVPRLFQTDRRATPSTETHVVAVVGPGTAFPGNTSTHLSDFQDGTENTILLVECVDSQIEWLEPRDLELDAAISRFSTRDRPAIVGPSWRNPYVVFADGITCYSLTRRLERQQLQALLTLDGGESVTRKKVVASGQVER